MEIFVILVAFLDADERPIQNHFDNGGCVQILPRERNGGRNIKVIKIVYEFELAPMIGGGRHGRKFLSELRI